MKFLGLSFSNHSVDKSKSCFAQILHIQQRLFPSWYSSLETKELFNLLLKTDLLCFLTEATRLYKKKCSPCRYESPNKEDLQQDFNAKNQAQDRQSGQDFKPNFILQ